VKHAWLADASTLSHYLAGPPFALSTSTAAPLFLSRAASCVALLTCQGHVRPHAAPRKPSCRVSSMLPMPAALAPMHSLSGSLPNSLCTHPRPAPNTHLHARLLVGRALEQRNAQEAFCVLHLACSVCAHPGTRPPSQGRLVRTGAYALICTHTHSHTHAYKSRQAWP